MQATTMVYSLFGLVLGLAISEILRGFADTWRGVAGVGSASEKIRIGWAVPLLGTLIIMDQTQFYIIAYQMRNAIPFTYFSMLCVLGVVGVYFLCSTFVFPDDPNRWPDFDAYFMRVRRIVTSGMLVANAALFGFALFLLFTGHALDTAGQTTTLNIVFDSLFMLMLVLLMMVRSQHSCIAVLCFLNLDILVSAFAPMFIAI